MPGPEKEALSNSTFGLKMGGAEADGLFQSISGIGASVPVVRPTQTDAKGKTMSFPVPGAGVNHTDITLTRAFNDKQALYKWHREIITKGFAKTHQKDITIELYDNDMTVATTWAVKAAWPSAHSISGLDAGNGTPVTETFTFTHEGVTRK